MLNLPVKNTKEALKLAFEMLKNIENGKTYSYASWYVRMEEIEKFLKEEVTKSEIVKGIAESEGFTVLDLKVPTNEELMAMYEYVKDRKIERP